MIRGLDRVDSENLFPWMVMACMRGHSFKLRGDRYRTDVRGRFFTQSRKGVEWSLDKHMDDIGIV